MAKDTIDDVKTLVESKQKMKEFSDKYDKKFYLDESLNIFNSPKEVVTTVRSIKAAEKRIIKRVKNVALLNEYEKSKRNGLLGKLKVVVKYMTTDLCDKQAKIMIVGYDVSNSIYGDIPVLGMFVNCLIGLAWGLITVPFVLAHICACLGIRFVTLLKIINNSEKLKDDLIKAGVYDEIVDFVNKRMSSDAAYERCYDEGYFYKNFYKNFINDKIVSKKG